MTIDDPPDDLHHEPNLRAWFTRLPPAINVLVAVEVAWLGHGDRDSVVRTLRWYCGSLSFGEFAKSEMVFTLDSQRRRRTARRRVSLANCVAHAERGSWTGTASECARLVLESPASSWKLADVLMHYANVPLVGLEFAGDAVDASDRQVLLDLLFDEGWAPFDEAVGAMLADR